MAALGTAVPAADGSSAAQEHELRVLYEIIHTVNSTLDLEQVLGAIVRLVNDAIVAHATYIFLSEDRGRRIVLRAASERYAHLSGRVSMAAGEGIAGWVLQNGQPVFIPEKALADPRIKYFPELEEEKYQSLVSVPLIAKGQRVIGVIALHAAGPARVQPAGRRVPAARRLARGLRDRERAAVRAHAPLAARARAAVAARRAHRARRVGRRAARGRRRAGARPARRRVAARLPARAERRPAAHARSLARRARRARHRLPARAERRAAAHAGQRRHAHLGARRHALGRRHDALRARRAAGRGRRGDGLPRRAAGRGPARERARARPRELDRVADRARPQAPAAGRAAGRAQPHQGSLRRARDRAQHRGDRGAGAAPRHRRGRARRRRLGAARRPPAARPRGLPAGGRGVRGGGAARHPGRARRSRRGRRCACSRPALAGESVLERIEAIAAAVPDSLAVGISNVCSGPGACAAGFTEAQQAARALPVLRAGERHLRYDQLGVYKYLLRVPPGRSRARQARRRAARPGRARPAAQRAARCRRSRSSCGSAATSARRPARSMSTPTRCASGCGASRSSRASTRARPTGSCWRWPSSSNGSRRSILPGRHT